MDDDFKQPSVYFPRMITGVKAEEAFIAEHQSSGIPVEGVLRDVRAFGCGYDFEIQQNEKLFHVEVKGLEDEQGGVSFTSKEWEVAGEKRDSFYLVVVRSVFSTPSFQVIRDPFAELAASRYVYTTVQVKWNVSDHDLKSTVEDVEKGSPEDDSLR